MRNRKGKHGDESVRRRTAWNQNSVLCLHDHCVRYRIDHPFTQRKEFVLNRPFLFVISSENGTPLFVGIVEKP